MFKVKILDCTLRDGGRIINCKFSDDQIVGIADGLAQANLDIVEVGFLRDDSIVHYNGNSTFFTTIEQAEAILIECSDKAEYVLFVDYGMYDFNKLTEYVPGQKITGLRVGFTKKNFSENLEDLMISLRSVKDKGYKLYIQGVNSIGYTDMQILEIIKLVNNIHPYSFGIVDTYGAMYPNNLRNIFSLIDKNLEKDICIDFHSHNNFQMSFALAQEIIKINNGSRFLIIDSTLMGMGKCAGNLNTELIADYMYRLMQYNYDNDKIFDLIDEYIVQYKKEYDWGYTVPAMMAGIYKSHPNNIIYLTEKFDMDTKDIKYMLNQINEEKRMTYDYDNIEKLFIQYNSSKINDENTISELTKICCGKEILVLNPGITLKSDRRKIEQYVKENSPVIFTVNFLDTSFSNSYTFFGNQKRYKQNRKNVFSDRTVVTSNVKCDDNIIFRLDYSKSIECGWRYFGNSTLLLLRTLFNRLNVDSVTIAGFDGYIKGNKNYYREDMENNRMEGEFEQLNRDISQMLNALMKRNEGKKLNFLTDSYYERFISC